MPAFSASAPGKIILFGEHAVVYGRPAIAAPVGQVKAKAIVTANPKASDGEVHIQAAAIGLDACLDDLPATQPLAAAVRGVLAHLGVKHPPACSLKVTSTIPLAAGLGSGAAVSVAVVRAFSAFLGHPLPDTIVNDLAFEVEKLHHGTPSGIDNTVVTYARPVYFVKGQPIETLQVARPFAVVIGDTGIPSPTKVSVGDVRKAWQANKAQYEAYFDSIHGIVDSARAAMESGAVELLGPLMDANHGILRKLEVSCEALDALTLVARRAGALGAKLCGGGRGGNMVALVAKESAEAVAAALTKAGAVRTIVTEIGK